jgi:uncharacterized membrane protein
MLWIIFAFFILLLGTAHPPPLNDLTPLGVKRQTVGALCMVMLLLCIHYAPITNVSIPQYEFEFQCENSNQVVDINGTAVYVIEVTNTENEGGEVKFDYEAYSLNTNLSDWKTVAQLRNSKGEIITNIDDFELKGKESFYIKLNVTPNQNIGYGGKIFHHINVTISGITKHTDSYTIKTHVGTFDLNRPHNQRKVGAGDISRFDITIENLLDVNDSIQLTYNITSPEITKDFNWTVSLASPVVQLGPQEFKTIYLNVTTPFDAKPGDEVEIELKGTSQLNPKAYDSLNLIVRIINI